MASKHISLKTFTYRLPSWATPAWWERNISVPYRRRILLRGHRNYSVKHGPRLMPNPSSFAWLQSGATRRHLGRHLDAPRGPPSTCVAWWCAMRMRRSTPCKSGADRRKLITEREIHGGSRSRVALQEGVFLRWLSRGFRNIIVYTSYLLIWKLQEGLSNLPCRCPLL